MPPRIKPKAQAPVPKKLNARGAMVRDRFLQLVPEAAATKKRKHDHESRGRETKMFPNLKAGKNDGPTRARAEGVKTEARVRQRLTPGGAVVRDRLLQGASEVVGTGKRKRGQEVEVKVEEDDDGFMPVMIGSKRLTPGGAMVRDRLLQGAPEVTARKKGKRDQEVEVKVEEDNESTTSRAKGIKTETAAARRVSKTLNAGGEKVRARLLQVAPEASATKQKRVEDPQPREGKKPEPHLQVGRDNGSKPAIVLTPSGATASGPTSSSTSTKKRNHGQEIQGREGEQLKMFPNLRVEPAIVRSKLEELPGPSSSTLSTISRASTSGSHPGDEYKRLLETETPASELQDHGNRVAEFWDGVLEESSSP